MNTKRIFCIVTLLLMVLITACQVVQPGEIISTQEPEAQEEAAQTIADEDESDDQEEPSLQEDVEPPLDSQTHNTNQNALKLIESQYLGKGWVNDFAWSPDGNTIALHTLSAISLIDIYTHEEIVLGPGTDFHTEGHLITFSPDGKMLAVIFDEEVKVYDVESQKQLLKLDDFGSENYAGKRYVLGIAFSPEGNYLATGSGRPGGIQGSIRIWDVSSGSVIQEYGDRYQKAIHNLTFNKEGDLLATIDGRGQVCIWNLLEGTEVLTFTGTSGWGGDGRAVAFSPDGRLLAAGGRSDYSSFDAELHLFDSSSGDLILDIEGHQSLIESLSFNKDGNLLASASMDDTVRLWDTQSGEQLAVLDIPGASSVGFSPDGTLLATAGIGDGLRVWRLPEPITN